MTESASVLELKDLSMRFGDRVLFRDLTLSVEAGEKIAVTGESGCGKSTLLNLIIGFRRPDSGMVRVDGREMTGEAVWTLRSRIGYVPQEPDLGGGLVREILERPFAYRVNRELHFDPGRVEELFHEFRLETGLMDQPVARLSGGEKQRVALISSLLLKRKLYLLDEVTSSLDDMSRNAVFSYCRRRSDMTVIAVTHDREMITHCRRFFRLANGELEEMEDE